MQDWYSFMDPRQYYYTSYVAVRAKQQEVMESNFKLIEKNQLMDAVPSAVKEKIKQIMTPLRHVEYGANMNNQDICDRGYGASITSLASMNGFDRIGMAQYISRITLLIDGNEESGLIKGREDWLHATQWQGLRHAMEDIFVLDDWFEIMVAQNVVMDGLIFPLIYDHFVTEQTQHGATPLMMTTTLMKEWYAENIRWTNQLIKVTAAESEANKKLLSEWVKQWTCRLYSAIEPLADSAFEHNGKEQLDVVKENLLTRLTKQGLSI
jgi:phenol hydroxylase P1 protein